MTKGIVYYSDCRGDPAILETCWAQLLRATAGLSLVSVTLQPVPGLGLNIVPYQSDDTVIWVDSSEPPASPEPFAREWTPLERGRLTMFRQILAGLEALDTDVAFLAEHDVLYPPEHFDFTPPSADRYYYDVHWYRLDAHTGRAVSYLANQVSGLCADRELLIQHYRARVARTEQAGYDHGTGYEPGNHPPPRGIDHVPQERFRAAQPYIDIRHGCNITASRWSQDGFRDKRTCTEWREVDEIPGWGPTKGRFPAFLADVRART
jgi:hypothetical protein